MRRRDFLKNVGVVAASAGSTKLSFAGDAVFSATEPDSLNAEIKAFSSSFVGIPTTYGPTRIEFDKALPDDLSGTLYRNGPALFSRGATEYHHWFDGDGMIQSFQMQGSTLVHKASMVQTSRYLAEQEAGRFLWPGFGTSFTDGNSVTRPDDMNVANISVLPVKDELWALWEGGSAWAVDPESLQTIGRKVLSTEADGLSFSAHPRVDVNGRIWNFGYVSGGDTLILYDISASGKLDRIKAISTPNTNMVHDFAMTDEYLVFVLLPITFNVIESEFPVAFSDMLGWNETGSVHVLVVTKANLEIAHRIEMPSFFAFHFGNAWQDGKQIRVELAISDAWSSINQQIKRATQGKPLDVDGDGTMAEPAAVELVIDLQRKLAKVEKLPISGADFPVFDERYIGLQTSRLTMLNRSGGMSKEIFGFNQLIQFDRGTGGAQLYDYGPNRIAEEHVFVPKSNAAEGNGWLLGTSYNWRNQLTSLSVFNAASVADGPIATAELPYKIPLGLHGKFVKQ